MGQKRIRYELSTVLENTSSHFVTVDAASIKSERCSIYIHWSGYFWSRDVLRVLDYSNLIILGTPESSGTKGPIPKFC